MCPPTTVPLSADIGVHWTDEEVCMSLEKFESGSPLPSNVIADVNPYLVLPSDLPEGLWYFCSGLNKYAEHGFWKTVGEVCEIFSNSSITGWRITLECCEGQVPHGRGTRWVMQEYRITEKGRCHSYKSKNSGALCRVFLADAKCPGYVLPSKDGLANIADVNPLHSMLTVPDAESSSTGKKFELESLEKNMGHKMRPSAVTERFRDPPENEPELDDVSLGDYLELDDLADPESRSSSSVNSSCMTFTSEECFDPFELLQELGDDNEGQHGKGASVKYNLSSSVKPKELVMPPATSGSLVSGDGSKSPIKRTPKLDYSVRSQQGEYRNECTSNSIHKGPSSSTPKAVQKQKKKAIVGRMKKLKMKYLWFMPF